MSGELGQHHEVVEADDAEPGRTFDQEMEQVGGGERIVERAMARGDGRGGTAANVPSLQSGTSSRTRRRASATVSTTVPDGVVRSARWHAARRNPTSKPTLWPTITASPTKSIRVPRTPSIRGAFATRTSDETGEHGDLRRNCPSGIDEGLERAEAFAAAHLDCADLGDHVLVAIAARGLEVDDAERDVVQRGPQLVERSLVGKLDDRTR